MEKKNEFIRMNDKPKYMDADSFQGAPDKLNFRFIVLEQVRRIIKLSSVEWRGGEIHERKDSNELIRLPDTREEFTNAVEGLYDILVPYFDDIAEKEFLKIGDIDDKLRNEFIEEDDSGVKRWTDDGYGEKFYNKRRIYQVARAQFRTIMKFLKRINYLEGSSMEENV